MKRIEQIMACEPSLSVSRILIYGLILFVLMARVGTAQEPWLEGPFAASAVQIDEAAAKLTPPDNVDVEVLLDETVLRFDADGRQTQVVHQVYRVLSEPGVDAYGTVAAAWSPWYQQRPVIRARVINRGGRESVLIDKEISEVPVQLGENLYSDQRQLQAPLPAVENGSIIETLVTIQDSTAYFPAGVADIVPFNRFIETRHILYRIEVPEQYPILFQQHGEELTFSDTVSDGVRRLEWKTERMLDVYDLEDNVPTDIRQGTSVRYCTARSWADVAEAYARIVDETLKNQDVKSQVEQILAGETDAEQKIRKILTFLQTQIRYTGLMLGHGSIVPTPPNEILRRRYGDCKDQSILLVALLRAAGVEADPVLLRSSFGFDVDPKHPGFGLFNHMIVRVSGDRELWIDPAAGPAPLGELPGEDHGRLCLVVRGGEDGLRRTPPARSEDNHLRRVWDVRLDMLKGTSISDNSFYTGSNAVDMRQFGLASGDREFRNSIRTNAEQLWASTDVTDIRWSNLRDVESPMEISRRCDNAGIAACTLREGQLVISPAVVLKPLAVECFDVRPYMTDEDFQKFTANPHDEAQQELVAAKQKRRRHPLVLRSPKSVEFVCRLHLPQGFEVIKTPEPLDVSIGHSRLVSRYENGSDGVFTALFMLDTGSEALSPDEVEQWQKQIAKICPEGSPEAWQVQIAVKHASYTLFEKKEHAKAFRIQLDEIAKNPEDIPARLRLAESYADFGFVEAGREFSLRTLEIAPTSSIAFQSAGFLHDVPLFKTGKTTKADIEKAVAFYRNSCDLDHENANVRLALAIRLQLDQHNILSDREMLLESAALLRPHITEQTLEIQVLVLQNLFFAEQYDEVSTTVKELPPNEVFAGYEVAVAGAQHGSEKAVEYARKSVAPEYQSNAMILAAELLGLSRRYEDAVKLLDEVLKRPDANQRALQDHRKTMSEMRKYEDSLLPDSDPKGVVQRAFVNATVAREFFGKSEDLIHGDEDDRKDILAFLRYGIAGPGIDRVQNVRPPERVADGASLLEIESSGKPETGFRVPVEIPGRQIPVYVTPRDGRLKILTAGFRVDRLGEEALRLAESDQLDIARQLLAWAFEDLSADYSMLNPFAGSPMLRLWKKSDARTADKSRIRLAAIALTPPENVPDPVSFLNEMRSSAKSMEQQQIDRVLVEWLTENGRTKEALEVVERLMEKKQGRDANWYLKGRLLVNDGQFAAAIDLAKAEQERDATFTLPMRLESLAKMESGNFAESLSVLRRIGEHQQAEFSDFNSAAWTSLFTDTVDDRALEDAQKAVTLSNSQNGASLHTLATIQAERGQIDDALASIRRSIDVRIGLETDPSDYYVLGRIAEKLEMPEIARMYYEKVIAGASTKASRNSSQQLSQNRLAVLRQAAAPAP